MTYAVVLEQAADGGWGAYAPDVPGLGVIGDSPADALSLMADGLVFHFDGLREIGDEIPTPAEHPDASAFVEVDGSKTRAYFAA